MPESGGGSVGQLIDWFVKPIIGEFCEILFNINLDHIIYDIYLPVVSPIVYTRIYSCTCSSHPVLVEQSVKIFYFFSLSFFFILDCIIMQKSNN